MGELIKVLIVDDHASLRNSFETVFCPEKGYEVVGSIPAAANAEAECLSKHPDIVVLDVCTEGEVSGLTAAALILEIHPKIKIIITSGFDEISYIPRAKEIGAHAFVSKDSSLEYFREVARRVLNGEYVFPEPITIPLPKGAAPFTEREMEVLRLTCQHFTPKQISEMRQISVNTVKKHLENMRQKAGFATAMQLVVHVLSHGWINPNY